MISEDFLRLSLERIKFRLRAADQKKAAGGMFPVEPHECRCELVYSFVPDNPADEAERKLKPRLAYFSGFGQNLGSAVEVGEVYPVDIAIADDVVAMIASLAASEVEGVSSPVGNITNELMSKVGMKKLTRGAKVNVLENVVTVDLSLVLDAGRRIPETCRIVQEKVKNAIETMTGLSVADVNIRISAIDMSGMK